MDQEVTLKVTKVTRETRVRVRTTTRKVQAPR